MRKVKNHKVIRNLADKSFRTSRTRNLIAALAIALTAMLFTSVFTIGLGTVESFQMATMKQSGGDAHGVIKDLTREQYETLKDHPLIKESADCQLMADEVCNPEFLKRHVEAWYIPEYHYSHWFLDIREGAAPQKEDEVLVDATTLELLGLPAKPGQEITLSLRLGAGENPQMREQTFQVSGVLEPAASNVGFVIVSKAYVSAHADELEALAQDENAMTGQINMDVMFSNSLGIQKKLNQVITESDYSVTEGDADYLSSNANWAYISDGTEGDPLTLAALAGGLVLILLTGYLIIYNVFQISVIRDIQYYGLLKTVGTTGRQIKRIVRRQAWKLAAVGIPLGLVLGFLAGKAIVPLVLARSAYRGETAQVSLNPLIFLGAVLFTLVTVWISTRKPAKIAARVSPIEAVRYTEGTRSRKKEKRTTSGGKISRMALSNLGRSKGRTVIIVLSLSLAVVLLNSVFTVTRSFDMNKFISKFSISDFLVANAQYFNSEYYGVSGDIQERNLSESFLAACQEQDGFERGGRIYETGMLRLEAATYQPTEHVLVDESGEYYWMLGSKKIPYEKDENGDYPTAVYGLEDFPLEKIEIFDGEKDLNTVRKKLATGNYLIGCVETDDNGKVREEDIRYEVGDKITLVLENGEKKEFEILSLMKDNYWGLSRRGSEMFVFYTTADAFLDLSSPEYLMSYLFDVEDSKEPAFEKFLEDYTESQEPIMHYESRQHWLREFSGMTDLLTLIGGALTLVIGIIGILNYVNTILTGIVTRRKEFAMMEAIGMTKRQLVRLLILEGLYYAGFTILCSLALGCLFSLTAVRQLAGGMWFMEYHFILWPMLAVFPVLLLLGALVPYLAYLPQRKHSVVEEIRRE